MLATTFVLGLAATAVASAIPESLRARIADGVSFTVVDPADIPEYIKAGAEGAATNLTARSDELLEKRGNVGVYVCTDANWQGHCVHIVSPSGTCVPLADDLNDKISSVGPDAGAYCRFYFNFGCPDNSCDHFDAQQPGFADLSKKDKVCGVNTCNDVISSYQCWD